MNKFAAVLITAFGMLNGNSVAAPVVQATLTLGNQATILCTDPVRAKAYATNFGDGTVSVIDLATLAVVATVPAGPSPRRALCNTATNRVYVVNTVNAGTVTVLDGNDHHVIVTIPVGSQPRTIGADLSRDELYVSNSGSDTVSIVSTVTHAVVGTVTVGTGPGFASASATLGKIYVPSATDGTVCVIDQSSRTVKTVKVGNGPQYAALDSQHGKVYVNNVTDRTMSVIDSATDTVVRTLPTGAGTSSNFAEVNGVYRRAYLPNASDGTLTIIDTETDTVVATLPVGSSPVDVTIDAGGGNAYVVNNASNSVSIIDAATEKVLGSYAVGTGPSRIAESSEMLLVLNANGSNPDTLTISSKENTVVGTEIATEFYHAAFNHYFHTADPGETRLLQDGLFDANWRRTFEFWRVWTVPGPGRLPVCRFFSTTFGTRSSHFYTPYAAECAGLQAGGNWQLESGSVYYLMLPDAGGGCPVGTEPLYRAYNNALSGAPNHRYTSSRAVRNQMVVAGWTAEGGGPDVVFACTPTRRGN